MNAASAISQATPAQSPTAGTPEYIRSAYVRALERATAARLVAYKNDDGSYEVPSVSTPGELHVVRFLGRRWYDCSCTCRAANHAACMHRAVAIFARKHGVSAVRPVPTFAEIREAFIAGAQVAAPAVAALTAPASVEVMRSPEYLAAREACLAGVNPFGF